MIVGTEWLIEAVGCDEALLRDEAVVRSVMTAVIDDLGLKSVGAVWHKFEGEGGVTGLIALTESHLACHTYPEHGIATFNLYCCRTRREWNWDSNLRSALAASSVSVTRVERGESKFQISDLKSQIAEIKKSQIAEIKNESEISDLNCGTEVNFEKQITDGEYGFEISDLKFEIAGGRE